MDSSRFRYLEKVPGFDWDCNGQIKADPDIAGVGVAYANCTTSVFATILSFLLWYWSFVLRLGRETSAAFRIARNAIVMIGDTQLLMTAAITIASLIMIKAKGASSLYHIFIARCLASVNMVGHGAAIIYGSESRFNWDLRLILMTAFVPLYIYLTMISVEEFENFGYQTPLCFKNENIIEGKYTFWMKIDILWMPPGYVVVLMQRFKRSKDWVDRFDEGIMVWPGKILKSIKRAIRAALETTVVSEVVTNSVLVFNHILLAFSYLLLFVGTFLAITPPSILPFSQLFFWLWAIYDEVTIWYALHFPTVESEPGTRLGFWTNPAAFVASPTSPTNRRLVHRCVFMFLPLRNLQFVGLIRLLPEKEEKVPFAKTTCSLCAEDPRQTKSGRKDVPRSAEGLRGNQV